MEKVDQLKRFNQHLEKKREAIAELEQRLEILKSSKGVCEDENSKTIIELIRLNNRIITLSSDPETNSVELENTQREIEDKEGYSKITVAEIERLQGEIDRIQSMLIPMKHEYSLLTQSKVE
jgi:uncharacterized protein (DUF342 family)